MDIANILIPLGTFIGGGGLVTLFTLKPTKKKAEVSVHVDEIKALHDTIDLVYKPIIEQQNKTIEQQSKRIEALEGEVKNWRKQLLEERAGCQKEIDAMNKRILAITSALGMKAFEQIRDERGRFTKNITDETEG